MPCLHPFFQKKLTQRILLAKSTRFIPEENTSVYTSPNKDCIHIYLVLSTEQGTQDANPKMWLLPFTQSSEGTTELRQTYKCSTNTDEGRNTKSSKTENGGENPKMNDSRSSDKAFIFLVYQKQSQLTCKDHSHKDEPDNLLWWWWCRRCHV